LTQVKAHPSQLVSLVMQESEMRSLATALLSVTLLLAQMQVLQADDAHHQPKTNQSAKKTPGISTQTAKKSKQTQNAKTSGGPARAIKGEQQ
jgi:hypothetical protein